MIMKKRKPGRPKAGNPREHRVVMLLSDPEFDALDAEARALTLPPNVAARALLIRMLRSLKRLVA